MEENKRSTGLLEQTLLEIEVYEKMMEEMANMPKEEMGTRIPGETCSYERQRLQKTTL